MGLSFRQKFFPLRYWTKIAASAVQATLRQAFATWGLPQHIRFDNGKPWGNPSSKVPTALALWLVGLKVQPLFGRPRQSTDNAVVERCHGVLEAWVEPQSCPTLQHLRQRLNDFVCLQREGYPSAQQSRLQRFPDLVRNPRVYRPDREEHIWDLQQVLHDVARFTFIRTVEKNGRITLMTHEYTLGRASSSQRVTAQLDPVSIHWVIKNRHGEAIAQIPALQFSYALIATLSLTHQYFKANLAGASREVQPYGA